MNAFIINKRKEKGNASWSIEGSWEYLVGWAGNLRHNFFHLALLEQSEY